MQKLHLYLEMDVTKKESEAFRLKLIKACPRAQMKANQEGGVLMVSLPPDLVDDALDELLDATQDGTGVFVSHYEVAG